MGSNQKANSKWPHAFVAVFGTIAISAASYFLKEPNVMWAMAALIIILANME